MAELQVLHQEPRHKVDDFVDEMTQRARDVIRLMGFQFEALLRTLCEQFTEFKIVHQIILLDDVHFEQVTWMQDGRLMLVFGLGRRERDESLPRHVDVENFVTDVVGRAMPPEFRDECVDFLRGMIWQFALVRKHSTVELRAIRFARPEWISPRTLAIALTYHKRPFKPQNVRID